MRYFHNFIILGITKDIFFDGLDWAFARIDPKQCRKGSVRRKKYLFNFGIMSNGISKKKVLEIISKNGQKCNYCSRELESYEVFVDHVVPKYRGGKNEISNLVICCSYCNSSKGKKTLEQFNIHKSLKEISNGFDVSFGDSGLMIKTKTTNLEENINILQSVVSHIKTLLL